MTVRRSSEPESPGKTRNKYGGDSCYQPVVAICDADDPKQRERTDMVLDALFCACIFILVTYLAVHMDKKRTQKKSAWQNGAARRDCHPAMISQPLQHSLVASPKMSGLVWLL